MAGNGLPLARWRLSSYTSTTTFLSAIFCVINMLEITTISCGSPKYAGKPNADMSGFAAPSTGSLTFYQLKQILSEYYTIAGNHVDLFESFLSPGANSCLIKSLHWLCKYSLKKNSGVHKPMQCAAICQSILKSINTTFIVWIWSWNWQNVNRVNTHWPLY